MTINSYYDTVDDAALGALGKVGAVVVCPRHPSVTIRTGDEDAERHAYALATTLMKRDGTLWMRDDVLSAIKEELDSAADGECPECAHLRDD